MLTAESWKTAHLMGEELARNDIDPNAVMDVAEFAQSNPNVDDVMTFIEQMSHNENPLAPSPQSPRYFQGIKEVYTEHLPSFVNGSEEFVQFLYWVARLSQYYRSGSAESFYKQMGKLDSVVMPTGRLLQPKRLRNIVPGMVLEGIVRNIRAYGVFVDVKVKRDGLIHISELSHDYVKDPSEVVSVGDRIQVKVLEVDPNTRKLSLSLRALQPPPEKSEEEKPKETKPRPPEKPKSQIDKFEQRYDAQDDKSIDDDRNGKSRSKRKPAPPKKHKEKTVEYSDTTPETVDPRLAALLKIKEDMKKENGD